MDLMVAGGPIVLLARLRTNLGTLNTTMGLRQDVVKEEQACRT